MFSTYRISTCVLSTVFTVHELYIRKTTCNTGDIAKEWLDCTDRSAAQNISPFLHRRLTRSVRTTISPHERLLVAAVSVVLMASVLRVSFGPLQPVQETPCVCFACWTKRVLLLLLLEDYFWGTSTAQKFGSMRIRINSRAPN